MSQAPYPGGEVLELMERAHNYNAHLLALVLEHAAGAERAVDFGAGNGTFAAWVQGRGLAVVCVEPDAGLRRQLAGRGLESCADLAQLPPGQAPYIYTLNVLEHIDADGQALESLYSRLCPGGRLLVYVPAFPVLYSGFDRRVGHRRRYTRGQLGRRLRRAGFTVERLEYVDSLGFAAALLFRGVDRGAGRVNPRALVFYDRWLFPLSRWLDRVCRRWFGKNLLAVARRPG